MQQSNESLKEYLREKLKRLMLQYQQLLHERASFNDKRSLRTLMRDVQDEINKLEKS